MDVNASAILRLGLPSTTSRTPPSGVGHVRSSCTTSTTSWRSVAGEYRKSASIPSRGEGSPIPWPGELGRGAWVPRVSGKKGVFESESERSHNSLAQENCDIYPVPRRSPVARQPHSHRFCASTGDRKSNHRVAPIVCSQFALLSPDPATSQQSLASYLRQQCPHVEKDVASTGVFYGCSPRSRCPLPAFSVRSCCSRASCCLSGYLLL